MHQSIILAYDGSQASQIALINCKELSQWLKAEVHLLAVIPYNLISISPESTYYCEEHNKIEQDRYLEILNHGVKQITNIGANTKGELRRGDPREQIVEFANKISADLIVLGRKRDESWNERWWRGSISKDLIENSPCSVLVTILE